MVLVSLEIPRKLSCVLQDIFVYYHKQQGDKEELS